MFRKRGFLFLFLILTALVWDVRTSNACSCGGKPTVLDAYTHSNVIVIVQAMSVEKAADSQRSVHGVRSTRMIVEKIFKGPLKPGDEMIFAQGGGGDCIWTFSEKSIGQRFLLYLSSDEKSQKLWYAYGCGRSTDVDHAGDDLLYLENISKVRGKTRLSGTLQNELTSAIEDQKPTHINLDGRRVKIVGEKKTYELTTNRDGVYEIYDLPPGKYVVQPEIPDGWKIAYPSGSAAARNDEDDDSDKPKKRSFQVILEAGKHAYYDFGYGVNNAIRGKVFDTAGKPMKSVCLDLLPAQGKASRYFYESACTKKDGTFEIEGISPGAYVIVINKDGKLSSAEPFPTFYYPNVIEREKAAVITIGPGHILDGINIYVPRMDETISVEGVARYLDGKPVGEGSVYFEAEKPGEGIEGKARAETDSNGRFTIKILKGLKGRLYGQMYAYSGQYESCPKLEELIKSSGRIGDIKTNAIDLQADEDIASVELRFPFPGCKKAK